MNLVGNCELLRKGGITVLCHKVQPNIFVKEIQKDNLIQKCNLSDINSTKMLLCWQQILLFFCSDSKYSW